MSHPERNGYTTVCTYKVTDFIMTSVQIHHVLCPCSRPKPSPVLTFEGIEITSSASPPDGHV